MKCVFQKKDLQMFSLNLNKYEHFNPLEVEGHGIAPHNFKWVKNQII